MNDFYEVSQATLPTLGQIRCFLWSRSVFFFLAIVWQVLDPEWIESDLLLQAVCGCREEMLDKLVKTSNL